MEITSDNFDAVFPHVEECISKAAFIAFDFEFLGLHLNDANRSSLFDSPADRYAKHRAAVLNFPPSQLGIATFSPSKGENAYKVDVFNIYLFKRLASRSVFSCSVSALTFLSNHDFDFNKFISKGVSYANADEMENVRRQMAHDEVDFENFGENFGALMTSLLTQTREILEKAKKEYEFKLDLPHGAVVTGVQRDLLIFALRRKFDNAWFTLRGHELYCRRIARSKRRRWMLHDQSKARALDGICGAGKIVHAIIDARVPLIGHNCLIDFLYLYQYLLADLPESYESWKRTFAQPFPVVFDTRLLATRNKDKLSLHGVNSYSLESLGTYFAQSVSASHFGRQQPDLRLSDAAKKRYQCGAHYHEAGYDALMTGQVFLRMAYFAALQSAKDRPAVQSWRQILFAVRPLGNQLALSMMSTPFVNLAGPDPVYKRPNTIIVRPIKWFGGRLNAGQLKRDLDAFGRGRCDVKVLSSRCALVATNTDVTYSRVFTFLSADEKYRISTCLDDATKGLSSVCFNRSYVVGASIVCLMYVLKPLFLKAIALRSQE